MAESGKHTAQSDLLNEFFFWLISSIQEPLSISEILLLIPSSSTIWLLLYCQTVIDVNENMVMRMMTVIAVADI